MPIIYGSKADFEKLSNRLSACNSPFVHYDTEMNYPGFGNVRLDSHQRAQLRDTLMGAEDGDTIAIQGNNTLLIDRFKKGYKEGQGAKYGYFHEELNKIAKSSIHCTILIVVSPTRPGGGMGHIELANMLAQRGYAIKLLTLSDVKASRFFPLQPDIEEYTLPLSTGEALRPGSNSKAMSRFTTLLMHTAPDMVLSYRLIMNAELIHFLRSIGIPTCVAYRGGPELQQRIRRDNVKKIFDEASTISIMLEDYKEYFPADLKEKITINSLVLKHPIQQCGRQPSQKIKMLFVGRLEPDKNIELLIETFNRLCERHDNVELNIVGDGSLRKTLASSVHLDNVDKVHFHGWVNDVGDFYRDSALLVLPSYSEGIANVLIEALAHALPVICFDNIPSHILLIKNGVNGILVKHQHSRKQNVDSLTAAASDFLSNKDMRGKLSVGVIKNQSVLDRFSLDHVLHTWEACIQRTLSFVDKQDIISGLLKENEIRASAIDININKQFKYHPRQLVTVCSASCRWAKKSIHQFCRRFSVGLLSVKKDEIN